MSNDLAGKTLTQLVSEHPWRANVFEKFDIDYCALGKRSLDRVCRDKGLPLKTISHQLAIADAAGPRDEKTPVDETLTELCDQIMREHHDYLRRQMPRIGAMIARLVVKEGSAHPRLAELQCVFDMFCTDMLQHLLDEEELVFPICRRVEQGDDSAWKNFQSQCVDHLIEDHDDAGMALGQLYELTDGYQAPAGAGSEYREMVDALRALKINTHQHVYKENCVLFPRVIAMSRG